MDAYFDEEPFLTAFRRGDKKAFDHFFHTHWERVYARAFAIIRQGEEAYDVSINAFTEIYHHREQFSTPEQIVGRLFISVRHDCLDYLTKRRKLPEYIQRYKDLLTLQEPEMSEFEQIFLEDELEAIASQVRNALDTLSPECKRVIELLYYDDLKYHEVATALKISINTVKSYRRTALKTLSENKKLHSLASISLLLIALVFTEL